MVSGVHVSPHPAKSKTVWIKENIEKEKVLRLEGQGEVEGPERGKEQKRGWGGRVQGRTPNRPARLLPSRFCQRNARIHAHGQTHARAHTPQSRELCTEKPEILERQMSRHPGWKTDGTPMPGIHCLLRPRL